MRLFQMSTQTGDALANASFALDHVHSLAPIRDQLLATGLPVELTELGHVWGFRDRTVFNGDHGPRPGDVGLRVETGGVLRRIYTVLATFAGDETPRTVNGREWISPTPEAYIHTAVFAPYQEITPRNYVEAMISIDPDFTPGYNFRGKFIETGGRAEAALEDLLGRPVDVEGREGAPDHVVVRSERFPRTPSSITRLLRPSNAAFRARVFSAQRKADGSISCAACSVQDEDLLEAAHIVDEGLLSDAWWNGLPLCRNHHRLFDLGKLRIDPESTKWTTRRYSSVDFPPTKTDLSGLQMRPSLGALRWKWTSDLKRT